MCNHCNFQDAIDKIDAMINDEDHRYVWAFDTLNGIKETMDQTGHITPRQADAVLNIIRSVTTR